MNYRQLQAKLKQFRNAGELPANFKLNQKKQALMLALKSLEDEQQALVNESKFQLDYRHATKSLKDLQKIAEITIANEGDSFEKGMEDVKAQTRYISSRYYQGKDILIVPVTHIKGRYTQWMNSNHMTEALLYIEP